MDEYDNTLLNRNIYGGSLTPVIVANMISYEKLVDCLVNAMITVDYEHHEIHEGNFFMVSDVNLTLGAAATFIIGASIPVGTFSHFRFTVSAGGATHVEAIENAQLTGGAALVVYNANRNGPAAPFAALTDPTIGGGTTIIEYVIASGQGPKAAGGAGGMRRDLPAADGLRQLHRIRVESCLRQERSGKAQDQTGHPPDQGIHGGCRARHARGHVGLPVLLAAADDHPAAPRGTGAPGRGQGGRTVKQTQWR